MATLLITPAEVLEQAFPSNEYVSEELILSGRIETAQLQLLQPVFGTLYPALSESRYATFTKEYIQPALAYYIRYQILDERCASMGATGVIQTKTTYAAAASDNLHNRLRKQARNDANTLLKKAVDHVEQHPELFPEYDPQENIRKYVLMQGGFIL